MSNEPTVTTPVTAARTLGRLAKRRPAVTDRDQILRIAQTLVDEGGLDALTMRNLAKAAGVSVNTVYATAGDKEAILQGMVNALLGEIVSRNGTATDPRAELIAFFRQVHGVFLAHPAIGHLAALQPIYGPEVFSALNTVFVLLGRLGLDRAAAVSTCHTLISYTIGFSVHRIPRDNPAVMAAQHERISTLSMHSRTNHDLLDDYVEAPHRDDQFVDGLNQILRGATCTEDS